MTQSASPADDIDDKAIVFDGAAAPTIAVACPACGASDAKRRVLRCRSGDGTHNVYGCLACQSLFYHPYPAIDYTSHTDELRVRDYLEMNASIDIVARNVLRTMPGDGRAGRMLDIGCGFGFALDVVRTLNGWTVKGYEPSQYGALGHDQLGLDIVNDFAPVNADPAVLYDVVHCSEVIEHVHDAAAFVDLLCSYLAPDGVLVLTTPDPQRVRAETGESLALALLSPGAHTILFSDQALTDLFRKAGLAHVAVDKSQVSTLYYASRRPLRLAEPAGLDDAMLEYFASAARRAEPGFPLDIGMRHRHFRKAMELGRFVEAGTLFVDRLVDADPRFDGIEDSATFAAKWPFCIASGTYYEGMRLLLHAADYRGAARTFEAAHRLCEAKVSLMPQISVVEADLMWRATFHQALSLKYADDRPAALAAVATMAEAVRKKQVPPDLPDRIDGLRGELQDQSHA